MTHANATTVMFCVLMFHAPDGSELLVDRDAIRAIRQVEPQHRAHLMLGTNSILYLGIRPGGFAVTETPGQIVEQMKDCRSWSGK